MSDSERCVFIANGQMQAQQVRSFLEAQGVRTSLRGETLSKTHGFTIDGLGAVQILVDEADEEQARALLASAEAGDLRLKDDDDLESTNGE